jgi:hypothetical protein
VCLTGLCICLTKERDLLENLYVDGRIILKGILNEYYERTWTGLIRLNVKDKWRATVNTVVILRVSHSPGNFYDSLRNCAFSGRTSTASSYFKIKVMTSLRRVLHVLYDWGSVR